MWVLYCPSWKNRVRRYRKKEGAINAAEDHIRNTGCDLGHSIFNDRDGDAPRRFIKKKEPAALKEAE